MAKVQGPLFSLEARGKVADSVVFFPWKGRHVVRQWLKPTNPQSTLQGYVRAALKAIARWIKKVAIPSNIYEYATAACPAGLNWNAWLMQGYLNLNQVGGVFNTASFEAIIDEYNNSLHSDTDYVLKDLFESKASALGLEDFAMNYGYTSNISKGMQLYFGAKACYEQGIHTAGPYTKDPVSWNSDDLETFYSDHLAS